MSSTQRGSKVDNKALIDLVDSSSALIAHYLTTLTATPSSTSTTNNLPSAKGDPPNPLHVLKDAALLLKSHTTKLGLLLLNPPFTPSAISSILRTVTTSCLPALLSAVELADPSVWGSLLRAEATTRVIAALRAFNVCLADVKRRAGGEEVVSNGGRDTLASTGAVWETCDALVELEALDVGGLALRRAKAYQALLADALEELKAWRAESVIAGEKGEDDDEEDEEEDEDENDMFGGPNKLPRDRPELLFSLDDALGKIKRVELLYTAICKRRVTTFTKERARIRAHVRTMDSLLDGLKKMPEITDELASSFYDLDEETIDENKVALVDEARRIVKLIALSWNGAEDEFTTWSNKWLEVMK